MGQNNDPTEHGDLQGQQGAPPKLSPEERKRQSGYPIRRSTEYLSGSGRTATSKAASRRLSALAGLWK